MPSEKNILETPEDTAPHVLLFLRSSCSECAGERLEFSENDQERLLRGWLKWHFCGSLEIRVVKAGHEADSHQTALTTVVDLLRTGCCKLLLVTSLDRFGRGLEVFQVLELAAKSKARVVAIDDGADTTETDWRILAMLAGMKQGFVGTDGA